MADRAKKISELPVASSVANTDIFIIVANTTGIATTKQISVNTFKSVAAGIIVPTANVTTSGTVKVDGSRFSLNAAGYLVAGHANSTVSGVVNQGNNIYINDGGFIGVFGANTTVRGVVSIGNNITVNSTSGISVAVANTTALGVVKAGNNIAIDSNGAVSVSFADINFTGSIIGNKSHDNGVTLSSNTAHAFVTVYGDAQAGYGVEIFANTGSWLFQHNGGLQFPDTSIQTTAFQKVAAPANSSSTGTAGQIAWDTGYLYICTANNTWKRAALSTW